MNSVRAPSRIRASLLSCIASAYIGTEGGCERPRNHPVGTTYISAPNQSGWGVGGRRRQTLLASRAATTSTQETRRAFLALRSALRSSHPGSASGFSSGPPMRMMLPSGVTIIVLYSSVTSACDEPSVVFFGVVHGVSSPVGRLWTEHISE